MTEVQHNIAFQVPPSLARRLDAYVDRERNGAPVGNMNRSSVIRSALVAFLADTPDPKAESEAIATSSRGRSRRAILGIDSPRRPKLAVASEPSPVRTRTRPAPISPAAE